MHSLSIRVAPPAAGECSMQPGERLAGDQAGLPELVVYFAFLSCSAFAVAIAASMALAPVCTVARKGSSARWA